jgi:hypothetical protein
MGSGSSISTNDATAPGEVMTDRTFYAAAILAVILAVVVVVNGRDILRYALGLPVYRVVDYDRGLTREAARAKPVIAALDRCHHQHGRFPAAASQLTPYLPPGLALSPAVEHNIINGCFYRKYNNGNAYELRVIFGRDEPTLRYKYEGLKAHWVYDDGSTQIPVRLNP